MFPFSKPDLLKKWISFVNKCQPLWKGLVKRSLICSTHFESDCFEQRPILEEMLLGWKSRKRLTPNSVPTLYGYDEKQTQSVCDSKKLNNTRSRNRKTRANKIPDVKIEASDCDEALHKRFRRKRKSPRKKTSTVDHVIYNHSTRFHRHLAMSEYLWTI